MNKIMKRSTFSKLVIMFDSDVIAVPWRENVLIIFLHKKMKRRWKWKWVDEKMNEEIDWLITWSWWGEGGERREEISLEQREVIGQIDGSIETKVGTLEEHKTNVCVCVCVCVCVFGL